jgi:hypothetical protein
MNRVRKHLWTRLHELDTTGWLAQTWTNPGSMQIFLQIHGHLGFLTYFVQQAMKLVDTVVEATYRVAALLVRLHQRFLQQSDSHKKASQ